MTNRESGDWIAWYSWSTPSQDMECGSTGENGCFAPWLPGHTHGFQSWLQTLRWLRVPRAGFGKAQQAQCVPFRRLGAHQVWVTLAHSSSDEFVWHAGVLTEPELRTLFIYICTQEFKSSETLGFLRIRSALANTCSSFHWRSLLCFGWVCLNETEHKTANGAECFGPHIEREPLLMWCVRLLVCALMTD